MEERNQSSQQRESVSPGEFFIPYKNVCALIAYYLAVFSVIPALAVRSDWRRWCWGLSDSDRPRFILKQGGRPTPGSASSSAAFAVSDTLC